LKHIYLFFTFGPFADTLGIIFVPVMSCLNHWTNFHPSINLSISQEQAKQREEWYI